MKTENSYLLSQLLVVRQSIESILGKDPRHQEISLL